MCVCVCCVFSRQRARGRSDQQTLSTMGLQVIASSFPNASGGSWVGTPHHSASFG